MLKNHFSWKMSILLSQYIYTLSLTHTHTHTHTHTLSLSFTHIDTDTTLNLSLSLSPPLALASTAHYPPTPHAPQIIANPRPFPLPFNCALFLGWLLLKFSSKQTQPRKMNDIPFQLLEDQIYLKLLRLDSKIDSKSLN